MKKVDEGMMKAVLGAIQFASIALFMDEDETAASDFISDLSTRGYKIVRDGAE